LLTFYQEKVKEILIEVRFIIYPNYPFN
jgi:hypothetical protein